MIYSGGCTIKWSPYTLTNNTLSGFNTLSFAKPGCIEQNLDDKVLAPFFNKVKYANYESNSDTPYLLFYD